MENFKIMLEYEYKGIVDGQPFYELKVSADREMGKEELLDWIDWGAERIEESGTLQRIK
jgi:ABC-type amino acid transport substrate-binding protein